MSEGTQWHLGSHEAAFTPTQRGFLSHTGYWQGKQDYFDHTDHNQVTIHSRDITPAWHTDNLKSLND